MHTFKVQLAHNPTWILMAITV